METSKKNLKYVNLKGFRVVNELSQKEIAEYLEVSIAFISAVERGQAKLPADKFLRLIENDQDWETAPLLDQGDRGTRVHNDHRNISNNIEGEFTTITTTDSRTKSSKGSSPAAPNSRTSR